MRAHHRGPAPQGREGDHRRGVAHHVKDVGGARAAAEANARPRDRGDGAERLARAAEVDPLVLEPAELLEQVDQRLAPATLVGKDVEDARHPCQAGYPDVARDDSVSRVSIARGTFIGFRADVATAASALLMSVIVARGLGPENRGVFFLALLVASVIALVGNLGLSTASIVFAATREIPLGPAARHRAAVQLRRGAGGGGGAARRGGASGPPRCSRG